MENTQQNYGVPVNTKSLLAFIFNQMSRLNIFNQLQLLARMEMYRHCGIKMDITRRNYEVW